MASIAIGDIHANLQALNDLLSQLEREVVAGDTVIFLGDYIDRGPDARRCIDRILQFRAESAARVVTLLGNHEDWFVKTMGDYTHHSWLLVMDAFPTIDSYSPSAARDLAAAAKAARGALYEGAPLPYEMLFDAIPADHMEFFNGLLPFHQTSEGIFAHAGLDPQVETLDKQPPLALLMGTSDFVEGYRGPQVVVYGHRNNAVLSTEGWPGPRLLPWTIGVDTISHGVLTAIRLPDRAVFQSAQYRRAPAGSGR